MAKVFSFLMHKQDTSRNKTSLSHACFAHNLSSAIMSLWVKWANYWAEH